MGTNWWIDMAEAAQEASQPFRFGGGWSERAQTWGAAAVDQVADVAVPVIDVVEHVGSMAPPFPLVPHVVAHGPALPEALDPGFVDGAWQFVHATVLPVLEGLGLPGAGLAAATAGIFVLWRLARKTLPHIFGLSRGAKRQAIKVRAAYHRNILSDPS